jgi:putative oxidoreductase
MLHNNIILLIARVLLSVIFILSGFQKFGTIEGTAGYIASIGLPAANPLAWVSAIFEAGAGIAILIGFQTRYAAYLLAAFCLFTGLVFHLEPADQTQMIMLMKNFALAGGFLALSVAGPGNYSVDHHTA